MVRGETTKPHKVARMETNYGPLLPSEERESHSWFIDTKMNKMCLSIPPFLIPLPFLPARFLMLVSFEIQSVSFLPVSLPQIPFRSFTSGMYFLTQINHFCEAISNALLQTEQMMFMASRSFISLKYHWLCPKVSPLDIQVWSFLLNHTYLKFFFFPLYFYGPTSFPATDYWC